MPMMEPRPKIRRKKSPCTTKDIVLRTSGMRAPPPRGKSMDHSYEERSLGVLMTVAGRLTVGVSVQMILIAMLVYNGYGLY